MMTLRDDVHAAAGARLLLRLVVGTGPGAAALDVTLPGSASSVSSARRLTRGALAGCPRADDMLQAVTELAANAVMHSASGQGGTFTVRVRTAPRWARLEVTDDGAAAATPPHGNGWGLPIVAAVTDRYGAAAAADGRRTAWAEVTWPAAVS